MKSSKARTAEGMEMRTTYENKIFMARVIVDMIYIVVEDGADGTRSYYVPCMAGVNLRGNLY